MLDNSGQLRSFSSRGPRKRRGAKEEDAAQEDENVQKEVEDEEEDHVLAVFLTTVGLGALAFITFRVLMPRFGIAGVLTGYSAGLTALAFFTSLPTSTLALMAVFPFAIFGLWYLLTDYREKSALRALNIPEEMRHDDSVWHKFQNDRVRISYCKKEEHFDERKVRTEDDRKQYLCRRTFFFSPWDCVEEEIKRDERIQEIRRQKGFADRL